MLTQRKSSLDGKFAALAHPLRREILARLSRSALTLTELAAPYNVSVPAVAKHIKMLEAAGLICKSPRSSTRPLSLAPGALNEIADWMLRNRIFWTGSFDRLESLLKRGDA